MCPGGGSMAAALSPFRSTGSQPEVELDDHYLVALAKQGRSDAYDRIMRRYYGFVRLKASSYFLIGGGSGDPIQGGLVGPFKAGRDHPRDPGASLRHFRGPWIT